MNKQEFQKTIRNMEPPKRFSVLTFKEAFNKGFNSAKNNALFNSCFLDEPEKPVVPQVAVEFYERYKDDNLALGEWFGDFYSHEAIEEFPRMDELTKWLHDNNDETNRQRELALATLVTLGIDAVEVEKEKLYTVELPSPNCPTDDHYILSRLKNRKIIIDKSCIAQWKKFSDCQLTEAEIKQDFEWAFQFAKEVKE